MKFDRTDKLVLLSGFLVLLLLFWFLTNSLADVMDLGGKTEVGTITFRYREAQRKFSKSVLWKNIEQNEQVFNFDSIRTDDLSEAIIHLKNGVSIELDPQSMIVVEFSEEHNGIRLLKGSVLLKNAQNNTSLLYDNSEFFAIKGSLRIRNSDGTRVFSEQPFQIKQGDDTHDITSGSATIFNNSIHVENDLVQAEPQDNQRYFIADKQIPVEFSWQQDGAVTLEIRRMDKNSSLFYTATSVSGKLQIPIPEGMFLWRIKQGKRASGSRKLRVIRMEKIQTYSPVSFKQYLSATPVFFNWDKQKLAKNFSLLLYRDKYPDGVKTVYTTYKNHFSTKLEPGTYYWLVQSEGILANAKNQSNVEKLVVVAPETEAKTTAENTVQAETSLSNVTAAKTQKSVTDTTTEQKSAVSGKITAVFPASGAVIDMSNRDSIPFRWQDTNPGTSYRFTLINPSGKNVFTKTVAGTTLNFSELSVLDIGTFRWEVESLDTKHSSKKLYSSFGIKLSEEPDAPELQ